MSLYVRPLLVLRALAALCFCFFECGGKGLVFPFFLLLAFWPGCVLTIFTGSFTYFIPVLGIPIALILLVRPMFRFWPRTDWQSQVGPMLLWLLYVGNLLGMFFLYGCWPADYVLYSVLPPAVFLGAQVGILLADRLE